MNTSGSRTGGVIAMTLLMFAAAQKANGKSPVYVEAGPVETSTLYANGREVESPTWRVWRPMCGSHVGGIDEAWLQRHAERHRQAFDGREPITVLSAGV